MNNKNLNINTNNLNISNFPSKFPIQNYIVSKCLSQSKKLMQVNNDNYTNKDIIKDIYYNSITFNSNHKISSQGKYLKFYTPYKKENLTNRKKGDESRKLPKLQNLVISLSPKSNCIIRSMSAMKKIKEEDNNDPQIINNNNCNNCNTIEQIENKYREIIIEKNNLINKLQKQNQEYKNIIEYIKLNYNINVNDFIDNETFNENLMTIDHNTNNDFMDKNKYKNSENNAVYRNDNRIMNLFRVKRRENENINKLFEHQKSKSPTNLTLEKKDNGKTIINNNINIFNSIEINKGNKRINLAAINMNTLNSNKETIVDPTNFDKNKSKEHVRFLLHSNLNNGNHKINDIKNNTVNNKFLNNTNIKKTENVIETIKDDDNKTCNFNYKESYEELKNRTNKLISNLFSVIEYKCGNK